jgi:FtsH-binding integral membrane protein
MESALAFFYALTATAIAFVAITVIAFMLRVEPDGPLNKFHRLLMMYFIESGLIVAGLAILPGFIALSHWPDALVWRSASIFAPFAILPLALTYARRRRRVKPGEPIPIRTWFSLLVLVAVTLGPVYNLLYAPEQLGAFLYAIAPFGLLLTVWVNFPFNIRDFGDTRQGLRL